MREGVPFLLRDWWERGLLRARTTQQMALPPWNQVSRSGPRLGAGEGAERVPSQNYCALSRGGAVPPAELESNRNSN